MIKPRYKGKKLDGGLEEKESRTLFDVDRGRGEIKRARRKEVGTKIKIFNIN